MDKDQNAQVKGTETINPAPAPQVGGEVELTAEGRDLKNLIEVAGSLGMGDDVKTIAEDATKLQNGNGEKKPEPQKPPSQQDNLDDPAPDPNADPAPDPNADPAPADPKTDPAPDPNADPAPADPKTDPAPDSNADPAPASDPQADAGIEGSELFTEEPGKTVEVQDIDGFKSHIKNKLNIDLNTVEGLQKLANNIGSWRNDSQQTAELSQQVNGYEELFTKMPQELVSAVNAWRQGRSYQEVLYSQSPEIDYNKSFDSHDQLVMLNKYFPGAYTAEMLVDKENEQIQKALGASLKAAQNQFARDKEAIDEKRVAIEQDVERSNKDLTASVDHSVNHFKQTFPAASSSAEKTVKKILSSGDLRGLFFDANGNFLPDAAVRVFMAKFGQKEVESLVSNAKVKAANSATQKTVKQVMKDQPAPGSQQNKTPDGEQSDTVKSVAKMVSGLTATSPYDY